MQVVYEDNHIIIVSKKAGEIVQGDITGDRTLCEDVKAYIKDRYAKPGDIILDTHVGSASSLIACYRTNHPYVGFELDKHYYDLSKKRLDAEMAQMQLSDFMPEVMP